jgi:hypothetical protein
MGNRIMSSIIRATTSSGLQVAPDNSGSLQLQTNGTTTAVTIDTSQRAAFVAGTAAAPAITTAGDTNTGMFFPAADTIAFAEGGAEAMRLDSSGNVGIGTTSPATKLDVIQSAAASTALFKNTNASYATDVWLDYSQTNQLLLSARSSAESGNVWIQNATSTGSMLLMTNGTERVRIDSSGNLLFNSGYGSVATAYGCRAWISFNGTGTIAIRGSGNVSSIVDGGTGLYTVNFTNAMPDANYSSVMGGSRDGTSTDGWRMTYSQSTSSVLVRTMTTGTAMVDHSLINIAILR